MILGEHGFGKQGTTALFEMRVVNLDTGSYLCMLPEKALEKSEKDKKDTYLQLF